MEGKQNISPGVPILTSQAPSHPPIHFEGKIDLSLCAHFQIWEHGGSISGEGDGITHVQRLAVFLRHSSRNLNQFRPIILFILFASLISRLPFSVSFLAPHLISSAVFFRLHTDVKYTPHTHTHTHIPFISEWLNEADRLPYYSLPRVLVYFRSIQYRALH